MRKDLLKRLIITSLQGKELHGYEISKELSRKGVKQRTNYVYAILTEMERGGLLRGRWIKSPKGPEKHLYSLGKRGEEEYQRMVGEAKDMLVGAFIRFNLTTQDVAKHANFLTGALGSIGIRPARGTRLVMVEPDFNPLTCYPLEFYSMSEAYPEASVYVVKPPGLKLDEGKSNLTFLDGSRDDIPLKDNFADYLLLSGFPAGPSLEDTVRECSRVLREEGSFLIRVANALTVERAPGFLTFADFILRELSNQEKLIEIRRLMRVLSGLFVEVREEEAHGNTYFYARGKKISARLPLRTSDELIVTSGDHLERPSRQQKNWRAMTK